MCIWNFQPGLLSKRNWAKEILESGFFCSRVWQWVSIDYHAIKKDIKTLSLKWKLLLILDIRSIIMIYFFAISNQSCKIEISSRKCSNIRREPHNFSNVLERKRFASSGEKFQKPSSDFAFFLLWAQVSLVLPCWRILWDLLPFGSFCEIMFPRFSDFFLMRDAQRWVEILVKQYRF